MAAPAGSILDMSPPAASGPLTAVPPSGTISDPGPIVVGPLWVEPAGPSGLSKSLLEPPPVQGETLSGTALSESSLSASPLSAEPVRAMMLPPPPLANSSVAAGPLSPPQTLVMPQPGEMAPAESAPTELVPYRLEAQPGEPAARPAAVSSPGTAAVVEQNENYTVVKVFYGTDRAAVVGGIARGPAHVVWLWATLSAGCLAVVLVWRAIRARMRRKTQPWRARLWRRVAGAAVACTMVLGLITAVAAWQDRQADQNAEPSKTAYGSQRGPLEMGTCTVSIPRDHRVGELESPTVLRLEFREDPGRHIVLLGVERKRPDAFFAELRSCIDRTDRRGAFVFVHGFNVTFEEAARRTAQMYYDLHYDGAPVFYSWPSQGKLAAYTVDESNVEWTAAHLKEFLAEVARQSGAREIHLIAHSMGNRALTAALRDLAREPEPMRPQFHQIVLTAPDIDAEVFERDVAPAIVGTAERVTLYASSNDEALALSKQVHGYPRAGDAGGGLVLVPGVDTIDVSAVDTSLLGHSYYGSNDSVLADIYELLHDSKPPEQRERLRTEHVGQAKYWVFQR